MLDVLTTPWWEWNSATASPWDWLYRTFNLAEATAWMTFAGLVLRRWLQHRHSPLELAYAGAFVTFGLTDVAEAWQHTLALLLMKGVVLVALLWLRAISMRRWHPGSRLY
ncbi:MAG: hypothetical protein KF774_15015 [Planctomyces sp.]|nr:hypothetical protein [Planctomyces sp.]